MIEIRPMRWWHLDAVRDLEADLFPGDPWTLEQFWQELARDTRHYLVALDGGVVVGYAGAFVLAPDADVQTIAVHRDRQGSGMGARLLAGLLSAARAGGATHVLLEVRSDNAAAVHLYDRFGFQRISERRRYYPDGGDALVMRASLGTG
jgi:ribosomal-protein-alanine N-acetyltransferase